MMWSLSAGLGHDQSAERGHTPGYIDDRRFGARTLRELEESDDKARTCRD